ncbi:MAG: YgfZ/GcvT domain-containing protein [Candidatus Binataceae bacterium]
MSSPPTLNNVPAAANHGVYTAGEYRALTSAAGLRLLDDRIVIRVIGDDRVSFLHGMCSNDIKALKPDGVMPALFLTERAHLIADCFMWGTGNDAILIEIDRDEWPKVRSHLEHLLIADDVEMEEQTGLGVLDIEGPQAHEVLGAALGAAFDALQVWHQATASGLTVANLPRFGGPAITVIGERARLAQLAADLRNSNPDLCEVHSDSLEIVRIENGVARVGVDSNDKTLALEARLERAISLNKGCYLGQETVERATARGGLKKRLYGVRINGARAPRRDAAIGLHGKEIGRLSSVARSPRLGLIGFAILHHSAWHDGLAVSVADADGELAASVCDLPFK